DYRAALDSVIEESDGLLRTFNTMLVIARAESGAAREAMSRVNVSEVVESVAELYEPSAEEAGQTLTATAEPDLYVHGNRELIAQAIANLIDNAIKYGAREGEGGTIEVSAARAGERIELAVADRGPGINAED